MKAKLKEINYYTKSFDISIPYEEYTKTYEKQLKKAARTVNLPGFRKGKVPAEFLRKKFHDSIHGETIDKMVQNAFQAACEEQEIYPLGNIEVEKIDFKEEKDLKLVVKFEVKPTLSDIKYKDLEIERHEKKFTKADISDGVKRMKEQYSDVIETTDKTKSKIGSFVTLNAQQLDDKGQPKKGHVYKDLKIRLGDGEFDKEIEKQLTGMKVADSKVIDREYGEDFEVKEMIGKKETYDFTVNAIEERKIPSDAELIEKIKDPEVKTIEDLKKKLEKNFKKTIKTEADTNFFQNAVEKLVSENDFVVPESMLENYLERLYEQQSKERAVNEEKFKSGRRDSALFEIKWELIKEFIQNNEDGLELKDGEEGDKELEAYVTEMTENEKERELYLSNDYFKQSIAIQLLNKKLSEFLQKENKVKKVKI